MCVTITNNSITGAEDFATLEEISMNIEIANLNEVLGLPDVNDIETMKDIPIEDRKIVIAENPLDSILYLPGTTEISADVIAEYVMENLSGVLSDPDGITEEFLLQGLT